MKARMNWLQDPLPLPLPVQMPAWTRNLVMVETESGRIQGEVTEIESRWVADAGTAATAVRERLAGGHEAEPSADWVKM